MVTFLSTRAALWGFLISIGQMFGIVIIIIIIIIQKYYFNIYVMLTKSAFIWSKS